LKQFASTNAEGDSVVIVPNVNELKITCYMEGCARPAKFTITDPDEQLAIVRTVNAARQAQPTD
jgi:hypothetical protein